jgi:CheY-like chemotaxis protein
MGLLKWVSDIFSSTSEDDKGCIDKEFYYQLLDLSLDAVVFYSEEHGCVGANRHFLSLFNLSSLDEYYEKYDSFHSLFSDEDEVILAQDDTVWLKYIHQMYPKGYGVRFIDESESVRHIQIFIETIEHNEQLLYYITLKEAQELHEIQSHLVANDAIKKSFLSDMQMQFRTPMQGILGFVKLLESTTLDERQKAYLSQVSIAAKELTINLETLLDDAEMTDTPTANNEGDFHPFIEIDILLSSFAQKAREREVKIYSDIDSEIPENLNGDTKKIKQLLVYLINYSLQIAHEKAELVFSMKNSAKEGLDDVKLECSLSISNTIADPRRDDLSIIRKLIMILGGDLEIVCSDDGSASLMFAMMLRVAKKSEVVVTKELERYRVLVVEDNRINQNLMRLMLEEYGLDVDVADNGQDAIDMAYSLNYNIIFMDIDMPVKNGIEATNEIKQRRDEDAPFMPIVAVTALAMQGDRERLLNAGLDDYIAKPITREMLVYILNKYLDIGV